MGKFATRTGDRNMRLGGDEGVKRNDRDRERGGERRRDDGDWRRGREWSPQT